MVKGYRLKNSTLFYCLVGFGCIFVFGIGRVHLFDLDELYFAEITREMIRTGRYGQVTFNFEPLYEKPPFFFWLQAAGMHLWGINEIGARFPNLVCGLLTLATLYYIGKQYKDPSFGFLWMCLYGSAFLPHFYFKSAIIDPFFNYFLLLAIYFLSHTIRPSNPWLYIGSGLSIGCALLTKGPMALVIPLGTLGLSYTWFKGSVVSLKALAVTLLIAIVVLSCWLIPEIWSNGCTFIKKFWEYHLLLYHEPVPTHNQPWYYHYLVLFFGCFPSTLFAVLILKQKKLIQAHYFAANMEALLAVVLLIFTLVGTKIVHYSSMAYFPITFFATDFLDQQIYRKQYTRSGMAFLFLGIGLIIGTTLALIPWMMLHKTLWIDFTENQAIKDALERSVTWNYWESIPGIIYTIGTGIAYYFLLRFRFIAFIRNVILINICTLTLFLTRIAPKVEAYSQKAMIDFCKGCKGKKLYLTTIGFKSAAPLFYADLPQSAPVADVNWLLQGPIDRPCFFILYKTDGGILKNYPDITYIKSSGCFAFYKRLPKAYM